MPKLLIPFAFLAATTPFAATAQTAVTARVSYADLDLARADHRKILDRRIAGAAEKLCPPLTPAGRKTHSVAASRCRAGVKASAQLQRSRAVARATASVFTADSR